MLNPYDWRVGHEQHRATNVCYELGLDPYDMNESGIERWRIFAIELAVLRIKLKSLGVSV